MHDVVLCKGSTINRLVIIVGNKKIILCGICVLPTHGRLVHDRPYMSIDLLLSSVVKNLLLLLLLLLVMLQTA
jgi:hypothetical protein